MASKPEFMPGTDFPRGIGNPAYQAITLAGYSSLEQLTKVRKKDLLALHGVGPKSVRILSETLAAKGMSFVDEG